MKCTFAFFVFHFCMHFCLCTHLMHKHRSKYSICMCLSALNRALLRSDWQRPPARKMNSVPRSTKSVVQVAVYSLQSQMQSQQCYLKLLAQSVRSGSLLYWTYTGLSTALLLNDPSLPACHLPPNSMPSSCWSCWLPSHSYCEITLSNKQRNDPKGHIFFFFS